MKPLSLLGGLARDRRQPDAPMAARLVVVGRKAAKVSERGQYSAETLALVDGLLASCAARHGVTPEAARSRRTAPAVAARHEWIRVLRACCPASHRAASAFVMPSGAGMRPDFEPSAKRSLPK